MQGNEIAYQRNLNKAVGDLSNAISTRKLKPAYQVTVPSKLDSYDFKKLYPDGREWINVGNSAIIAPNGQILAGPLEAEEGILYADIDFDQVIKAKRMFDAVGHYSRPDVFNFNIKHTGS